MASERPDLERAHDKALINILNSEMAPYWLAALVESADDAIISKTLDGIITSWNKGAERIFGYTPDEVIGKSITILIPKDHEDEEPAILARLKAGERIEHYETIRVRKDGSQVDISLTVSPIIGPGGQIIGASKIARDISETRRARAALDEYSARLNLALAASHLGDWSWDAKTDQVKLSDTAAHILDVPPGEGITWTELRTLLPPEDSERAQAAVDEALALHTDYAIEYRVIRADNTEVWVSARGRGVYDEHRKPLGMLGFVQDITNRKTTEDTLRDQAEALRTLNEVGRLISAELNLKKMVQAVTDAATGLTGAKFGAFFYNVLNERGERQTLLNVAGMPEELFANLSTSAAGEQFIASLKNHGVLRIPDVKQDRRYDSSSPFHDIPKELLPLTSYLAVPVVSRSGEIVGGLFLGHSTPEFFTERDEMTATGLSAQAAIAMDNARLYEAAKRARAEAEHGAAENERLYKQAEESSRLKEEFLATISHELRTPLNAILGWARMLRTGQLTGENQTKALDTIERNARAQAQLIDDLLDVSRIVAGKLRLDVRPTDPSTFIDAAVEAVRPAADAKGVHVQKIIDSSAILVPGDPARLQQVVWNLLSNAIKFTPRDGRVQIRLERVNSHIEIVVSDTGQGIAAEFLPYVFDRFRQADQKASRQYGGMGLGLAIVRHLVELHGGNVHAASEGEGKGSIFTVVLPVAPIYHVDATAGRVHPAAKDLLPTAECTERLDNLKILVVDDERDTRELLKEGLEYCGARVMLAGSAAEALESMQKDLPDVLISDIGMPIEDGYELIRQVRKLGKENGGRVPAIALTAYTRVEDRMHALRAGYHMHVPKPVELAELVAVAASVVRREN
ncbi:MAG TPA: PAS domain S-box protein [Pyrinomonadaceae bacterium]